VLRVREVENLGKRAGIRRHRDVIQAGQYGQRGLPVALPGVRLSGVGGEGGRVVR
jgi:hypothetical protein